MKQHRRWMLLPVSWFLKHSTMETQQDTIVITHNLSQIEPGDFVYVLKHGRVVEQGFRYNLESVLEEDGRET